MIVVDTSVWIPFLHGFRNAKVERLESIVELDLIVVGDLILLEILQGARSEKVAGTTEHYLRRFRSAALSDTQIAIKAAENYRALRSKAITVRKTIDVVIATYCIEHDCQLLYGDRDFEPFATHLGLQSY